MKHIYFFTIGIIILLNHAKSQTIAAWDFFGEGSPTSGVPTSSADVWNSNLDGSNLVTRGAGAAASNGTNSFRTVGFKNDGIQLSNTDYFQHTISAATGFSLSLNSINARFTGTTSFYASPGVTMQFAYSLDGTNFSFIGSPTIMTTNGVMPQINLSNIVELQNVPDNITVTIRYYASGQTATGGWGYNSPSSGAYGISFNGTLNCATQTTYYEDSDGDSFGNPNSTIQACSAPTGYVSNNSDCDDADASINPNIVWYEDADGDGFGNLLITQTSCNQPTGYVTNSSDCNDNNPNLNIASIFYQDLDGDGSGNPNVSLLNCGQPSGYVSNNLDCNDNDNNISPAAPEIADNIDNDCDGLVDEGFALLTWYLDNDLDGFGGTTSVQAVQSPGSNYTTQGGDCDDVLASVNPNAQEICDGIDNNCDGQVDNGLTFTTYYADVDGDTYGNPNSAVSACSQPIGYVLNNTDCDDLNASINPGAADIPVNGIDEDCNGVDAPLVPLLLGLYEFTQASACPVTANTVTSQPTGATFGIFSTQNTICAPAANVFNNSGWNLTQTVDTSEYNQFSIEVSECKTLNLDRIAFNHRCSASGGTPTWHIRSSLDNFSSTIASGLSGNNNNANLDDTIYLNSSFQGISNVTFRIYITGISQNGSTWRMDNVSLYGNIISLTPQTYYADNDGDGFGDAAIDSLACSIPVGYVLDNTDCNDQDSLVSPNTIWYFDADFDQIGDSTISFTGCIPPPTGYVLIAGDCDNSNPQISGPASYYIDADGDGFGVSSSVLTLCQNPGSGYVTIGGDCDDANASINPNATEICDGVDNDCDGLIDNGLVFNMYYVDADGDGFGEEATGIESCSQPQNTITIGGDCDDTNDQIYPGASEICDAVDNDCDGSIDEGLNFITYYTDADNDGFGTGSTGINLCEAAGPGFSTNNLDCNDNNNQINPNAVDILNNGIDENCDGVDGNLSIQEISKLNLFVSPNPNTGLFIIQLNQKVSNGEIKLMDLNGKVIQVYRFNGDSIHITENNIEKGVYLLNVSVEGHELIERLIVQ